MNILKLLPLMVTLGLVTACGGGGGSGGGATRNVVSVVVADADGDSIADSLDAFPKNKLEWLDADGDRVGDNVIKRRWAS